MTEMIVSRFKRWCKEPTVLVACLLSLALSIGAAVALYSVLHTVLYKSLPFPNSAEVVRLQEADESGRLMNVSIPNAVDIQGSKSFSAIAGLSCFADSLTIGRGAVHRSLCTATPEFFEVFQIAPMIGRGLSDAEKKSSKTPLAYISSKLWREQLQKNPQLPVLGSASFGQGIPVLGVLPDGFDLPENIDVWIIQSVDPASSGRTGHNLEPYARLAPGATLQSARAELRALATRLKQSYGSATDASDFIATPILQSLTGNVSGGLWLLFAAVIGLWLIACANVGSLLAARANQQAKEMATRLALGASQKDLRQLRFIDAGILCVLAGCLAWICAWFALQALPTICADSLPRINELQSMRPSLWILLAFVVPSVALSVWCMGLAARGVDSEKLHDATRNVTTTRSSMRMRNGLIVGQMASSLLLLSLATLLARSFLNVGAQDSGLQESNRQIVEVSLPFPNDFWENENYSKVNVTEPISRLIARTGEALRSVPGVTRVGATNALPMTEEIANGAFWSTPDMNAPYAGYAEQFVITGDYPKAVGLQLLGGRLFDQRDTFSSPHTALISKAAAEKFFQGRDPIGQEIYWGNMDGDMRSIRIVGMVSDTRGTNLERPMVASIYLNAEQRVSKAGSLKFIVQTNRVGAQLDAEIRAAVLRAAPDAALAISPMSQLRSRAVAPRRFQVILYSTFAALGLALSAFGLFSVLAYQVRLRKQELSIRQALGARVRDLGALVVRQGLKLCSIGVVIGLLLSLLGARFLAGMLFNVPTFDIPSFALVAGTMFLLAMIASAVPALRAMRTPQLNT
jgi:putative ABC transport system permease protein